MSVGTLKPFDSTVDDIEVWVATFKAYLLANKLDEKTAGDRCKAVLVATLGIQNVSLLMSLIAPETTADKTLDELTDVLKQHFKPAPKAISERYRFMCRRQKSGETVSQFIAELRTLAVKCQFTDLEIRLRDQFVFGLTDDNTQRKLFTQPDNVALKDVLNIAQSIEAAELSTSMVRGNESNSPSSQVHKTDKRSPGKGNFSSQKSKPGKNQQQQQCPNCGSKKHKKSRDCPHKEVECHTCGKRGHFARMCRSGNNRNVTESSQVNTTVSCHTNSNSADRCINISVTINGVNHAMELDTGCETSILSEDFWRQCLKSPKLTPSALTFRTYTKETFKPLGELKTSIVYNGQCSKHDFPVSKGTSLFGRDLLHKFKVDWGEVQRQCKSVNNSSQVTLNAILREYSDVFGQPKGRIKGFKANVVLKDDAIPKFLKARPIPFAVRDKVDKELDDMEATGVIEKISHSEWASPLVVVPKPNGKVRITGDFKNTVNSQLCVTQYPIANPEDLFGMLAKGTKFSKLDGTNAYHQIELEESSKKFLVVNTHRGLYRYNVLPQGIASSPAIFQAFMDQMLTGIPQTGSYIDDGLCSAQDDTEHLNKLKCIFKRMKTHNYYLSREKCEFMKESIVFLGHVITADGIRTDPKKVAAILAIQCPTSVTELKSFLGLVNFYGKFVPFLSDTCVPLYHLTKSTVTWNWTKDCEAAFNSVKKCLSSSDTLVHFDPFKPIGISCDASCKGLGVVLYHKMANGSERAIAYASKSLSEAEQRYSQIEKEGLSIVFGLKKFYRYLCGRQFTLITDHKPSLSIFGPKTQLPAYTATRLHHWSVFLSQFSYDIQYRNTKDHGNADALSRFPISEVHSVCRDVDVIMCQQWETLPITVKSIGQATSKDKVLSKVLLLMKQGWPDKLNSDSDDLTAFHGKRQELSVVQGVLVWGVRVIIPSSLQKSILEDLHSCHLGIVKMKSLARQYVWWPNIDSDIEQLCRTCEHCCVHRPDPAKAPLHPWKFPEEPWQRLHADLAGPFFGMMWLIVVDAHSKWPEVFCLHKDSTSASVIKYLRQIFVRFGLPEQLVTDNGRQFVSNEFDVFCRSNGIKHVTSSPYHPRSNGEAERFVQTFKRGMKSPDGDLEVRLQRFLFTYRLAPHSTTGRSPSELLLGRKPRCILDLMQPDIKAEVSSAQYRQCKAFNTRAKFRDFEIGDDVWVKTYARGEGKWSLGTLVKQVGPVTFIVKVSGREMKRHVDQLLHAAKLHISSGEEDDAAMSPSGSPGATTVLVEPKVEPPPVESSDSDRFEECEESKDKESPPLAKRRPIRDRNPIDRFQSM